MAEAAEIYQDGADFYVPQFEVRLGTKKLPKDVIYDVIQVTYRDSITEMDSFEITLSNLWDPASGTFKYSDAPTFDPPQPLLLWMGYFGKTGMNLMISGEITGLRPSFPSSGQSTIVVSGLNNLHRLTRRKQMSDTYVNMTDSEMAQRIAGRLKMELITDKNASRAEKKHEYVLQDNQYDIVFLLDRARRLGYEVFVKEKGENGQADTNELHFKPSDSVSKKSYILIYGESLIEFTPNLTTANQVEKVTVRGWDRLKKKPITGSATRDNLATRGVGDAGRQGDLDKAFKGYEEVITDRPVRDNEDAKQVARQTLENIAKDMLKGSGSTIGLPVLRAGTVIMLKGLGKRFSGSYFVTSTTHTISDGGYTTQFECRREEK